MVVCGINLMNIIRNVVGLIMAHLGRWQEIHGCLFMMETGYLPSSLLTDFLLESGCWRGLESVSLLVLRKLRLRKLHRAQHSVSGDPAMLSLS